MTFDAGSIESTLTLDRTPFQAGLAAAKREARDFTRQRITAMLDVDADTRKARTSIERMRRSFDRKTSIDIDADTGEAQAKIAALRAELAALGRTGHDAGTETESGFRPLLDAITIVGPSLIPLASGLAGVGAGVVGVGVDTILAVKGISAEVKQGTALGRQYVSMGRDLEGSLEQLQHTAARGVLTPFQDEVDKLIRTTPQLNQFVAQTSGVAGDVLAKGADALVHLFTTAEPLIVTAEKSIDAMVTRLDDWAAGGGGADFFAALAHDIPIATDAIGHLLAASAGIIADLEPLGRVVLEGIDGIAKGVEVIEKVPGLVTAAATAYVAYRLAVATSAAGNFLLARAGLSAAAAETEEAVALRANTAAALANAEALNVLAASQLRVAGAAGAAGLSSLRGRAAMGLGAGAAAGTAGLGVAEGAAAGGLLARSASFALTRALPAALVSWLGGKALKGSIGGTHTSDNGLTRLAGVSGDVLGDILSFHFGSISPDIARDRALNDRVRSQQFEQRQIDASYVGRYGITDEYAYRPGQALHGVGLTPQQQYLTSAGGRYGRRQINANDALSAQIGSLTDPAKISDTNDEITASIQKRITAEQKLFDTSQGEITLAGGLKVSYAAYNAEMEVTGQNLGKTTQFFRGHMDALGADQAALDALAESTSTYNQFITDSIVKYGVAESNVGTYATALGLTYSKITANATAERAAAKALGQANDQFENGNAAMQGWLAAISQVDFTTDTLSQRVGILGAGLTALRGTTLDMAGANLSAVSSLEDVANAIKAHGKAIGEDGELLGQATKTTHGWVVEQPKLTAGALQVQQAMAGAASEAVTLAQAIYQNTGNAHEALAAYEGLRNQFISTEVQAGKTGKQARNLANDIFGVPKDAKTFVELLNKDNVAAAIADLTSKLGHFSKIIARALVKVDGASKAKTDLGQILGLVQTINGTPAKVKINPVTGTPYGSPVGSTPVYDTHPHARGAFITEGSGPTADDVLVRVSRGEAIVSAREVAKHPDAVAALVHGTPGFQDGGYIPPSLITSGGGKDKKSPAQTKEEAAVARLLDNLRALLTGDLSLFAQFANERLKQVRRQLGNIADDLRKVRDKGYTGTATIEGFTREAAHYIDTLTASRVLGRAINRDQRLLANVRQERQTVVGAVLGQFDPGTSGEGYKYGILANLRSDVRDSEKFLRLRRRAERLGLDPRALRAITREGPEAAGANLQAIVAGGADYVERYNRLYGRLHEVAGDLGDAQTRDRYGITAARLRERIHREQERQTDIQRKMRDELHGLREDLRAVRRELRDAARQN